MYHVLLENQLNMAFLPFLRCVMKMDHHCPWINNCCGHLNHAYFTSFLLLAPLGCSHAAIIFIMTMYTQLYERVGGPFPFMFVFTVLERLLKLFFFFIIIILTADIIWLEYCKDRHECCPSVPAPHALQCACFCCHTLCLRFGTGHNNCCWYAFLHTGRCFSNVLREFNQGKLSTCLFTDWLVAF